MLLKSSVLLFANNFELVVAQSRIYNLLSVDYSLLISLPLSAADRMCRSGAVDIIVIDSVSALTPRAEIEVFVWHGGA